MNDPSDVDKKRWGNPGFESVPCFLSLFFLYLDNWLKTLASEVIVEAIRAFNEIAFLYLFYLPSSRCSIAEQERDR